MAKYRLNSAETLPNTINNVAVTKIISGKTIVTYSNYIRLAPGTEYETDDPAMIEFFKTYRRKVKHTDTLEALLASSGVPYDIEYCRSCGGKVKKINYQVVIVEE